MLVGSLTTLKTYAPLAEGLAQLWEIRRFGTSWSSSRPVPRAWTTCTHARHRRRAARRAPRYTRAEILSAFQLGAASSRPPGSRSRWDENNETDLFAFTLDKSAGSFSPTTRYRDYAI